MLLQDDVYIPQEMSSWRASLPFDMEVLDDPQVTTITSQALTSVLCSFDASLNPEINLFCFDDITKECRLSSMKVLPSKNRHKSQPGCKTRIEGNVCFPPFQLVENVGCIHTSSPPMDWFDAKAHCQVLGGSLFTTKERFLALSDYVKNVLQSDDTWIGLFRTTLDTPMMWVNGDVAENSWEGWGPTEPNANSGLEFQCVRLSKLFSWLAADNFCSPLYNVSCELQLWW